jgi:drug/metabolite transporter (DMT)-like permease
MDASRVAIILTMEVVFAALTSVLVGQEVLSPQVIFGGALMLVAMLVVEWPRKGNTDKDVVIEPMPH